jgi:hypothetical protein
VSDTLYVIRLQLSCIFITARAGKWIYDSKMMVVDSHLSTCHPPSQSSLACPGLNRERARWSQVQR